MIQIDLPTLVKRLNLFSRQALEMLPPLNV